MCVPEETFKKLSTCSDAERCDVAIQLGQYGQNSVDYLLKAINSDDMWVRMVVTESLGSIGDERAIDPLVGMLKDEDQMVRFMAAESLGKIGHSDALPALQETCAIDNPFVAIAAEEAISRISKE